MLVSLLLTNREGFARGRRDFATPLRQRGERPKSAESDFTGLAGRGNQCAMARGRSGKNQPRNEERRDTGMMLAGQREKGNEAGAETETLAGTTSRNQIQSTKRTTKNHASTQIRRPGQQWNSLPRRRTRREVDCCHHKSRETETGKPKSKTKPLRRGRRRSNQDNDQSKIQGGKTRLYLEPKRKETPTNQPP